MHPPLANMKHSDACKKLAAALVQCHEEHSVTKFFGACNKYHDQLVMCFKKQKRDRIRVNKLPAPLASRSGPAADA